MFTIRSSGDGYKFRCALHKHSVRVKTIRMMDKVEIISPKKWDGYELKCVRDFLRPVKVTFIDRK